jgi:DNA topoisomerase-2
LIYKRTCEIAATTDKVKVYFNDEKIIYSTFKHYVELYVPNGMIYDLETVKWKVAVGYQENVKGYSVSFVNGINTYQGGTHVTYVMDLIVKALIKMSTKYKLTPQPIKDRLILFVDAIIVNPGFTTQSKIQLINKPETFGSKYEPSIAMIKKLYKSGIIENIIDSIKSKESSALIKKTDGKKQVRILGYPKLEDALKAGTNQSHLCTLILTEGDSAKATAMAGVSVIERVYYGVFPLKGKLLNV